MSPSAQSEAAIGVVLRILEVVKNCVAHSPDRQSKAERGAFAP